MRVTSKGQVIIPQNVRESMGILPAEIEFEQDENGRWYIAKVPPQPKKSQPVSHCSQDRQADHEYQRYYGLDARRSVVTKKIKNYSKSMRHF